MFSRATIMLGIGPHFQLPFYLPVSVQHLLNIYSLSDFVITLLCFIYFSMVLLIFHAAVSVQIVHLKRFQFHNGRWVKSHKIVKFPFRDFDPTNYLVPGSSHGNHHHDNHNNNTEADSNYSSGYHDDDDDAVAMTTTAGVRHIANGHVPSCECYIVVCLFCTNEIMQICLYINLFSPQLCAVCEATDSEPGHFKGL